jgi:hypothetical protein
MASRDQRRQDAGAPPGRDDLLAGHTDTPDPSARAGLRRRDLLGAAAGVTAVSLATMVPAARAQTPGTTPGTTPGSSPTTAQAGAEPVEEPSVKGPDLDLVRFARSIELALVQVYDEALDTGRLKGVATDQAHTFHGHHREHAERMSELGGSQAPNTPNARLLATLSPRVATAKDEADLIGVLESIEESAAATYLALLADAEDWQLASTFATISPVDAQHVAAWNRVGTPEKAVWAAQVQTVLPANQGVEGGWDPLQYPVGPA